MRNLKSLRDKIVDYIKYKKRKIAYKTMRKFEQNSKLGRKFESWLKTNPQKSYAQYKQDLFVLFLYRNSKENDLFFIDIGANDGITLSNTYALEQSPKWGGVY